MIHKVYMAGPEVFLKNAAEIKDSKRRIVESAGMHPLFPLDNVVRDLFARQDLSSKQKGKIVYGANEKLMHIANGAIPNITPWLGIHMDVGTAFEIGYTKALGKPIEAYSNSPLSFVERQRLHLQGQGIGTTVDTFGVERDQKDGVMLEDFGLDISDNIMIDGAAELSGGMVTRANRLGKKALFGVELYESLEQFKRSVDKMAEGFAKGTYRTKAKAEEDALKPFLTDLKFDA